MDAKKNIAPPLAPGELLPAMVSEADVFTVLGYCRTREQTPAIWELEKNGAKVLPGVTAALGDTYNVLWSEEAGLKPSDQVPPSRQYWRGMLGETVETAAFEELHAKTRGDRVLAMAGTIEAARTILRLVSADDAEQLERVAEADAEADQLEQTAQDAQAEADALQELCDQMMAQAQAGGGQCPGEKADGTADGAPQSGNGSPSGAPKAGRGSLTVAQAQALADKLAQAKARVGDVRAQADVAHQHAQAEADALMGKPGSAEAEAKMRELARAGHAALAEAGKVVEELSETIEAWGLERGELHQMEVPEAFGLLQKMRKNRAFESFARLLGRLRAIAAKKARSESRAEGRRVPQPERGRDIARAHVSELAALTHPATRIPALQRWMRGELRLHGIRSRRPLGEGPVIVCEDASGSMDGAKQQWAKGVTLALACYAKLRRRAFGWILFDAVVHRAEHYPAGRVGARQMLQIAEARAGGGTNFEQPFRRAVAMIAREGLKKADIVLVTDGDCAVSEAFLQELSAAKRAHEFSVLTVICDVPGTHVTDAAVRLFSERVERVSAFTAEEAEQKVFRNL